MKLSLKSLFGAFILLGTLGANAQSDSGSTAAAGDGSDSQPQSHIATGSATIPPLDLTNALWIWTGEGPNIAGMRAFRKKLPEGKSRATCVTFAIAADDAYTVWVNGKYIGDNLRKGGDPGGSAFRELDVYSVALTQEQSVIAVNATNYVNVDGVILTGVVQYADGSQTAFVTDASWLSDGSNTPPEGFQKVTFDDKAWTPAAVIGGIGTAPWAPIHIAPFTGKACGQNDTPDHPDHPDHPVPSGCPVRPPLNLPDGGQSPYWEIRHTLDCEIRRLEEALFRCQREKQSVVDKLVIIIREISTFSGGGGGGNTSFCHLLQCDSDINTGPGPVHLPEINK